MTALCYDPAMAKRKLGPHFVRQWREYHGLSLREFAKKLESDTGDQLMSHANIGRIEKFQQPYSQEFLEAAAAEFGRTVVDLLTIDPTVVDPSQITPSARLRSALLAYGVDRDDLDQVVGIIDTFAGGATPKEIPSPADAQPASRPHAKEPSE